MQTARQMRMEDEQHRTLVDEAKSKTVMYKSLSALLDSLAYLAALAAKHIDLPKAGK
jgi:hypothetical protein